MKNPSMRKTTLILLMLSATVAAVSAAGRPVPIPDRARGAQAIVVGRVSEVTPVLERNAYGDHLIVSHAYILVEQAIKGAPAQVIPLDVEGGTIGDLTLHVSDLPSIQAGERAVFFIAKTESGANVPHLRGNGILKLDAMNHVRGSNLTLEDVKRLVQQGLE